MKWLGSSLPINTNDKDIIYNNKINYNNWRYKVIEIIAILILTNFMQIIFKEYDLLKFANLHKIMYNINVSIFGCRFSKCE